MIVSRRSDCMDCISVFRSKSSSPFIQDNYSPVIISMNSEKKKETQYEFATNVHFVYMLLYFKLIKNLDE